jgi:hypothetical protein
VWLRNSFPTFRRNILSHNPEDESAAFFYVLLTVQHLGIIFFVNNQLDAQFFFIYVYFYSLHVSGSHVPIIRRINCINTTSGICHLYRVTYTRCINKINSPDDGHMAARNM